MSTIQALREALYHALVTPPLQYLAPDGSTQTLPVANVQGAAPVDVPDPKPDPLVSFTVGSRGRPSLQISFRDLEIRLSVSTAQAAGADVVTTLYEAARARIESVNAESYNALSRPASGSTLAVTVPTIREDYAFPAAFEPISHRWYCTARLKAVAT